MKKHLSKMNFRKIIYKQDMLRAYKHTGKDNVYEVYKESLNEATNTVRKYKRNVIIIMAGMAVFYVTGYLIEKRRRWPVSIASPRGQCSN